MLNDREEAFLAEYVKTRNLIQSYAKVFGISRVDITTQPYELLKKEEIIKRLEEYKDLLDIDVDVSAKDYVRFLVRGAFADIGDYLTFDVEEVPEYNPDGTVKVDLDTGRPITHKVNRIRLGDSKKLDTSLITSISNGRDGVKLQLVDKLQCWEKLQKFFGWADDSNIKENLNTQILKAIAGKIDENWDSTDEYADLHEALNKDGK